MAAGDFRAKELIDLGNRLFAKREPMLSLWQEIAENFYVERSDFTGEHVMGDDFAEHLMDSYPSLLRRELGNSISSMLRPRERQWFRTTTLDDERDADPENAQYLEYVVRKMKSIMYDTRTKFVRATKECDHDFVTFGQGVISVEESPGRDHLFYRTFHLRDCAWLENYAGDIDHLHRKDKMTARRMLERFGEKNVHPTIKQAAKREPGKEFNVRCIVLPYGEYDMISKNKASSYGKKRKLPYVVIYVDADNQKVLREGGMPEFPYVIPRWHTVSGLAYAYSPTTCIGLPDARMMQQMTRIILEAGEKAVDPPVVAVEEAVREVNLAAGAITWADFSFDGKLREAVQPITVDNNMSVAFSMRTDMREMLQKAWFIDKLQMPQVEGADQMTAREVSIRQQEFIRNLLPLFEPIEVEYNSRVLDKSFALMRNMGAFPSEEVPDDLAGAEVTWQFESPVQDSEQRLAVSQFQETLQLIAAASQMGVQSMPVDLDLALKDAIRGVSAPADWFKTDADFAAEQEEAAGQQQMQELMAQVQGFSETAGMAAQASQEIDKATMPPEQRQLAGPGGQKALPAPKQPARASAV